MRNEQSFFLKNLLMILVIVTFVCVTIFIGSISFLNSFMIDSQADTVANINMYFYDLIDNSVNSFFESAKVWEYNYAITNDFNYLVNELDLYDKTNPAIHNIIIHNDDYSVFHISNRKPIPLTNFIGDLTDDMYVSKSYKGENQYQIEIVYAMSNGYNIKASVNIDKLTKTISDEFSFNDSPLFYVLNEDVIYGYSSKLVEEIDIVNLEDNEKIIYNNIEYLVSKQVDKESKMTGIYLIEHSSFVGELFHLDIVSALWLAIAIILILLSVVVFIVIRVPINKYLSNISIYHGNNRKNLPRSMHRNPIIRELHSKLLLVENKIDSKRIEVTELSRINDDKSLTLANTQLSLSSTLAQRREIESELNGYIENYKDILQLLPDNIFIIKGNGIVEYINDNFLQMINFKSDEIINKPLNRFIVDADVCFSLLIERDFDGIELLFKQKNSDQHIKLSVKTQRILVDDELQAILCVCRDVSFVQRMNFDYYAKNRELYIVNEISKIMTVNVDVERILQNITAKISALLDLKGCTIRFLEGTNLELVAYEGYQSDIIKHEVISLNDTHAGRSLLEGKIYIIRGEDDLIFPEERLMDAINNSDTLVFLPLSTDDKKFGVLSVASDHVVEHDDLVLLESISTNATIALEKTILFRQLKQNYFKTVEALLTAIEINTEDKKGHIHHVANLARLMGEHFYFTSSELDDIYIAGMLHDIDKIAMKDSSKSNELERANIRKEIVEKIGLNESIQNGVIYHKINYDLSNSESNINEQPFYAKIIQISNEFEKYYREFGSDDNAFDEAYIEIKKGSRTKYAPEMVRVLEKIINDNKSSLKEAFEVLE